MRYEHLRKERLTLQTWEILLQVEQYLSQDGAGKSVSNQSLKQLKSVGLEVYGTVSSMKQTARNSLAKSDKRSNVV
jgi:hypothetical protein